MIRNSGLVVISLVIGFLMLEGALRVFVDVPSPYPYSSPLLVSDRRGFWILDPGAEITMGNNVDFNAKQVRINANATRT
ncbi:MAG: hypothetical protein O2910_07070 [Proteobacteria bacterium]|nr:hypothetical protein [Pseudomonadota bacterium]